MFPRKLVFVLPALLGLAVGCESGPRSAVGFRLPSDGDVERGKAAFVQYECNRCHQVAGVEMLQTDMEPRLRVSLGGDRDHPMADGYLVTSIINPSYDITRQQDEYSLKGAQSLMPHYDRLTVRELTDIVAFLQSKYRVMTTRPVL